jgi:hypothetical protein
MRGSVGSRVSGSGFEAKNENLDFQSDFVIALLTRGAALRSSRRNMNALNRYIEKYVHRVIFLVVLGKTISVRKIDRH